MAAKKTAKKSSKKTKVGEPWPLTVFLLKPEIKTFKDALHKNSKSVDIHTIENVGGLVLKAATAKAPSWATRLANAVPDAGQLRQQSPGALLFVKAKGNTFAVTFGYGRSLLAPEAIVHDFGIRTVLNTVDPKLIRSMDSRTLEVSPQLSRKQFVEARPLAAFDLDRIHDLLKGVTGRVKTSVTKFESELVTGTDSLQCRVRMTHLNEISACCAEFYGLYEKKDYQANFDFIDHVRFVRDPALVKKLDARLLGTAKSKKKRKDFGFAPPRLLTGDELSRLRPSWQKTLPPGEIQPDAVRERLGELANKKSSPEAFIEGLKQDRIELCDDKGTTVEHWSLYRCLLLELMSNQAHILTTGDWYEVSKTFVDEIGNRFDQLVSDSTTDCPITLPKQRKKDAREDAYNAYAARFLKIESYDKGSLTTGMGADQVEPCDLLDTERGIFVHVKIGRSSSKLGHLFNQGLVATLTFLDDARARENLRKKSPAAMKAKVLQEPVQASKLMTVFAIVDKLVSGKPWRLPFFSMLVALSVTERITQRGVHAYTVRVDAA